MSSLAVLLEVLMCGGYRAAFSGGHAFLTYPIPHIIDYQLLLSPPLLSILFNIPDPPPVPCCSPSAVIFPIYSMLLHHPSLMSPTCLLFPSLPSRSSNREVIVSCKITADKRIISFFHLFSPPLSPSYLLFLLPHYTGPLNLKPGVGR